MLVPNRRDSVVPLCSPDSQSVGPGFDTQQRSACPGLTKPAILSDVDPCPCPCPKGVLKDRFQVLVFVLVLEGLVLVLSWSLSVLVFFN